LVNVIFCGHTNYKFPHYAVLTGLLPLPPFAVQIFSSTPFSLYSEKHVLLLMLQANILSHSKQRGGFVILYAEF
jgi:hypothetical protein